MVRSETPTGRVHKTHYYSWMPADLGARPPRGAGRPRNALMRRLLVAVLALATFAVAVVLAAWFRVCAGGACPATTGLGKYDPAQASKVYAADGRLITDLGLERRTVVPLAEMSPAVIAAFVSTEDKRFYAHAGVDWYRVVGAVRANVLEMRRAEGFSTITMQLARNLWPEQISGRDKSLTRKLREAKVAFAIERQYPKDKILELYLNQIDLGNRAFGVEAAAQRYFGKSVRDLNVAEASTLAAIPKAPSTYNPRRNPQRNVQRRNLVLGLLRDAGYLSAPECEQWRAYPLLLTARSDYSNTAEYFVEFIRQQLEARFGPDLYRGGLRIYTTLDLDAQQAAERALAAQLEAIEGGKYGKFPHKSYAELQAARGDERDEASTTPYLQGLAVVLEAKTGYIRALVGGRDFDDSKFNRVTQARRQAGSTFKPIVYAAAIEAGIPLSRVVVDEPFRLEVEGQEPWTPQNYDFKFGGAMSMRHALYDSRNIPAILFGREVGEDAVVAEALKFGLSTRIPSVPSIHIGAADVMPLEMVAAYTTFANAGRRSVPKAILRVEDPSGRILWQPAVEQAEVLPRNAAWLVTDALRDVVRRGTAAGSVGSQINFPAGGKTGTTNDFKDVWFIGFTPDLVGGIWVGFDTPVKIMSNAQGGRLAAPAWTQMMKEIMDRRPSPGDFPRPDDLVVVEIDRTTGERTTPFCPLPDRVVESYIPGTEPAGFCPLHGGGLGTSPLEPTVRPGELIERLAPPAKPVLPSSRGAMGGVGPDGRKPN